MFFLTKTEFEISASFAVLGVNSALYVKFAVGVPVDIDFIYYCKSGSRAGVADSESVCHFIVDWSVSVHVYPLWWRGLAVYLTPIIS